MSPHAWAPSAKAQYRSVERAEGTKCKNGALRDPFPCVGWMCGVWFHPCAVMRLGSSVRLAGRLAVELVSCSICLSVGQQ